MLRPTGERVPAQVVNKGSGVYQRRRRVLAVGAAAVGALVLFLAVLLQSLEARETTPPIDPDAARPDVVLANAAGVAISSPIRPEDLTGLGYHPEGDSFLKMSPRGENLSANVPLGLLLGDSAPEEIRYHLMGRAERSGPRTGALDVGAKAETPVYAPVSGTIVSIRPDPVFQEGANIVEIKPSYDPDVRVYVSLVGKIEAQVGPLSPVEAGMTPIGVVANSTEVLKPQISSYDPNADNHVTVTALRVS